MGRGRVAWKAQITVNHVARSAMFSRQRAQFGHAAGLELRERLGAGISALEQVDGERQMRRGQRLADVGQDDKGEFDWAVDQQVEVGKRLDSAARRA